MPKLTVLEPQPPTALDRLTNRDLVRLSTELLDEGGSRGHLSRSSAWTYVRNIKLFSTGPSERAGRQRPLGGPPW